MSILKVPVRDILPVVPFMADRDVRYYLNGIYVEPDPAGGVVIVATDGHTLAAMYSPDGTASQPFILNWSKAMTAHAKSASRKSSLVHAELETLESRIVIAKGKEEVYIEPGKAWIDGKYPDWRRVTPKEVVEGIPGTYQARYLMKAIRAGEAFGGMTGMKFFHAKDGGEFSTLLVRYTGKRDLLCMVMPMKGEEFAPVPTWAKKLESPQEPVQQAA